MLWSDTENMFSNSESQFPVNKSNMSKQVCGQNECLSVRKLTSMLYCCLNLKMGT